jgi:DNA-binding NtrC family response regulator
MVILLVDDEADIHATIGELLTDFGHTVISAMNGAEALRQLRQREDIEVILSDVRMPGVDGIRLLDAVAVRRPGLPLVLMTGHGDETTAAIALRQGAFDYLKKPVKVRQLLKLLDEIEKSQVLKHPLRIF